MLSVANCLPLHSEQSMFKPLDLSKRDQKDLPQRSVSPLSPTLSYYETIAKSYLEQTKSSPYHMNGYPQHPGLIYPFLSLVDPSAMIYPFQWDPLYFPIPLRQHNLFSSPLANPYSPFHPNIEQTLSPTGSSSECVRVNVIQPATSPTISSKFPEESSEITDNEEDKLSPKPTTNHSPECPCPPAVKQTSHNNTASTEDNNQTNKRKMTDSSESTNPQSKKLCLPFKCDRCPSSYKHRFELNRHIKVSHLRPHRCTECNKGFGHKNYLRIHIETVHQGLKSYECKICGKYLSTGGNLSVHIKTIHMGEKKYTCPICNRSFGQQCNMKTHMRRHEKSSIENEIL